MPSVKAVEMTVGIPGVSVTIWYNDSNLRIGNVEAVASAPGVTIRARIWDAGNLVYDRTFGQGTFAETVPGNHRMVQVTQFGETFLDLPPNITYSFNIQTVGS